MLYKFPRRTSAFGKDVGVQHAATTTKVHLEPNAPKHEQGRIDRMKLWDDRAVTVVAEQSE